jgi:hypothetical protein
MASSVQKNYAFMYHDRRQSRNAYRSYNAYDAFDSHAMFASSSSYVHDRNVGRKNVVHNTPRRNVVRKVNELSAFRDRGVPKPTSECAACPSPDGSSAWASAKG